MSTIMRWKSDQAELLAATRALRDLVATTSPPPRERLVTARWRLARALLRYLPTADRVAYARLRLHADAAARSAAARFAREAEAIYAAFEIHVDRWTALAIEADWPGYRAGIRTQAAILEDRLRRENAELLPWLPSAPDVPAARAPGDRNWAADGWRFRDMLGVDALTAQRA